MVGTCPATPCPGRRPTKRRLTLPPATSEVDPPDSSRPHRSGQKRDRFAVIVPSHAGTSAVDIVGAVTVPLRAKQVAGVLEVDALFLCSASSEEAPRKDDDSGWRAVEVCPVAAAPPSRDVGSHLMQHGKVPIEGIASRGSECRPSLGTSTSSRGLRQLHVSSLGEDCWVQCAARKVTTATSWRQSAVSEDGCCV